MPHSNQTDIDFYLKSLKDYNTQYGIGTNNGGNYEVRSSGQAPGFGYVNPETNNLFQFPQQPGGANASGFPAGSFEDFTHNQGYTQQRVPWSREWIEPDYSRVRGDTPAEGDSNFQTIMNIGDPMPGYSRFASGLARNPAFINTSTGGNVTLNERYGSNAWFDQDEGFVGYGEEEIQKRFQKSLLGAMKNAETV